VRSIATYFALSLAVVGVDLPLAAQVPIRDGLPRDLVGCYALFTATGKRVDSSFYNASPLVRLDSARHRRLASGRVPGTFRFAARLDTTGRSMTIRSEHSVGPTWWADSLSDSIRLSFSNGFSGAFVTLVASGVASDTLRGWIEEHWDFGPPTTHEPAYAVRVPCRR
jgi:hypothetical protein